MKNFYDVYNHNIAETIEDLPTIYCDMDMVLCDFLKRAEEVLGKPFPKADPTTRYMISGTKDFWASLEWMPGLRKCGSLLVNIMHIFFLHTQLKMQTLERVKQIG